jgi:hypothetical protein
MKTIKEILIAVGMQEGSRTGVIRLITDELEIFGRYVGVNKRLEYTESQYKQIVNHISSRPNDHKGRRHKGGEGHEGNTHLSTRDSKYINRAPQIAINRAKGLYHRLTY